MSSMHCRREGLPAPGATGGGLCQLGGGEYCSVGDRDSPSQSPTWAHCCPFQQGCPSVKFKVTQGWSPAVHQRSQPGVVLFPVLAALVPSPPVSSLYSGRQGFANIFQPA